MAFNYAGRKSQFTLDSTAVTSDTSTKVRPLRESSGLNARFKVFLRFNSQVRDGGESPPLIDLRPAQSHPWSACRKCPLL